MKQKTYTEEEIFKIIDKFKEGEEIFDLHIRGCRIDDPGGRTQKVCTKQKEWVLDQLKQKFMTPQGFRKALEREGLIGMKFSSENSSITKEGEK